MRGFVSVSHLFDNGPIVEKISGVEENLVECSLDLNILMHSCEEERNFAVSEVISSPHSSTLSSIIS